MKINSILCKATLCSLFSSFPTAAGFACCRDDITTKEFHDALLHKYTAMWAGNLSLIDDIFHPNVELHVDRFPSRTGKGSTATHVTNRTGLKDFITRSRAGWDEYYFQPIRTVAAEHTIAARWIMHGILGADFKTFPTPLKAGDPVTYNGTDFLVQDDCTGHIREVYIASDSISYFHTMNLTEITV
ncbi:hypothetical protein N7481_001600 [Penicillium waksmanii]|uniref:uncharacterized protein n=1 Tax=Penicillium waksmanii TaxID=69791 RepID=UPI0025469636|nr:uncharacterized protein N7481_001600 [Penicillium waksmanii]KAJ6001191.1 hypothetical protein N7481_001600 [Penicillium waksmanii]